MTSKHNFGSNILICALCVALLAIGTTALGGSISVYGPTSPSQNETDLLTGDENDATKSREVIHTDTQEFAVGQSFQLPGSGSDTYSVDGFYLKSATSEDFDIYTANLEVKVFQGIASSATLLQTSSIDLKDDLGDGTALSDISSNEWFKLTLDSPVSMTGGQTYSFLMFITASSGANNDHKWGIRRDNTNGGFYADGTQWLGKNGTGSWDANNWPSNTWDGVLDDGADYMFYVTGAVPEPSSLILLGLGFSLICVPRRRRRL
jgi:hypothetical protein